MTSGRHEADHPSGYGNKGEGKGKKHALRHHQMTQGEDYKSDDDWSFQDPTRLHTSVLIILDVGGVVKT
jgi:hypothetical protein